MEEEKGRRWVVKALLKSGASRVMSIGSRAVRDHIIKIRKEKGIKALKGIEPLQKYIIGAVLQNISADERKNMICIEIGEKKEKKGETSGSVGLA